MANVSLTCHDLMNEASLGFQCLPHVRVEAALRYVTVNLDGLILVALPQNSSFPLLNVGGTPGGVQVMQRDEPLLNIGAGAHLLSAAHEDADPASAHLLEQRVLFGVAVIILNESNVFRRHTALDELVL